MQDLLALVSLLLALPNLPTSKYLIKKLFDAKKNVSYHFVCSFCGSEVRKLDGFPINDERIDCDICHTINQLKSCNMFLTMPVAEQIKSIFQNPEASHFLQNRNHNLPRDTINDMVDGDLYKKLNDDVNLSKSDITLTINSDGMQKFKSSYGSIWCILAYINELPSKIRFREIIVTAIWFGKNEPCMQTFFKPLVSELQELQNGFTWIYNNTEILTRVYAICCCVDSKARAPILNMSQFNGYYSCIWCYHPGKNVKTTLNKRGTVKFPIVNNDHYKDRVDNEVRTDMANATINNTRECGMKGYSILSRIPQFDLVRGVVVDGMHCLNLGVTKALITLWLNGKVGSVYRLSKNSIQVMDGYLQKLCVNRTIHRSPRKISDFCHWKASEYKNFLLYYSLPLLFNILPALYHDHLILFVSSIFLLSQDKISDEDLLIAERNLNEFVIQYQELYGEEHMTYNVHQLLHITQSVKDLGPLWAHSCYSFESYNGIVLKQVNGPKSVVSQITHRINIKNAMNKMCVGMRNQMQASTLWFLSRLSEYNLHSSMPYASVDGKCLFDWALDGINLNARYRNICNCATKFYTKGLINGQLVVGSESLSKAKKNDSFVKINRTVFEVSCLGECGDSQNGIFIGNSWTVNQSFAQAAHISILVNKNPETSFFHIDNNIQFSKLILVERAGLKYVCDIANVTESE
jgi:hypothetical protein